jgi:hypothetical protein
MTPSIAGIMTACWTPSAAPDSSAPAQARAAAATLGTIIDSAISTLRAAA